MRMPYKNVFKIIILIFCLACIITPVMSSSIWTTLPKYPIAKGDERVISGATSGSAGEVAIWIFGLNWYERGTTTVGEDGKYEYTLPRSKTRSMASGNYYVIIQDPGSNEIFDVIEDKTTTPGITYARIRGTNETLGADVFIIQGTGRLQGSDAAEALVSLIQKVDDFSTVSGMFTIEEPWVRINTISDREAGSRFTITGTTNVAADNELAIQVLASSLGSTTKSGQQYDIIKVVRGYSGSNTWSKSVDTTGFISDEYIVKVEAINFDSTATSTFNILQGISATPTSQPIVTPTPTPIPATQSVIGAVATAKVVSASVALDDQDMGIIRWQGGGDTGSVVSWRGTAYGETVVEGKSIRPGETVSTTAPIAGSHFMLIAEFQDGTEQIIFSRQMEGVYQPVATAIPTAAVQNQPDLSSGTSDTQKTVQPDTSAQSTPAMLPVVGDISDTDRMLQVGIGLFLITILLIGVVLSKRRKPEVNSNGQLRELKRSQLQETQDFARVSKRDDSMVKHSQNHLSKGVNQSPKGMDKFPSELLSRYNPLEFLGEGGFARVYKVKRRSDDQIVAVKIPRIDEKTSAIFIKEVAAWYHLSHDNIVRLYSSDILPIPYLEMEYIDGIEINGKLSRDLDSLNTPVPLNRAIQITYDIAKGIAYAHHKGVYHHDLKPLNVLITSQSVPKIADFGLSKVSARSSITTNKGYSPLYAAPEQLDPEHYGNPDHRTDLYHLGLIFFELLTGTLPYDGSSPGVIIGRIVSESSAPGTLSSVNPDLAVYDPIMAKLIAKRMEDRFQNATEFQNAIQDVYALSKERSELLEDLKVTKTSLKNSTSTADIHRLTREAIRKSVRIALLHAQLQDRVELITALNEIRPLTSNHKEELDAAIDQVQYMIAEDLPLGNDWVDQLRILLGKIEISLNRR